MRKYINTELLDMEKLGRCVKISTMSATCKLGVDIKLENIYNYMELKEDEIVTIKYKGQIKTLLKKKKKRKNSVKKIKSFQNQLTLEVIPDAELFPDNKISIKVFRNGSCQMSGVKSLNACNYGLNKLIDNLKKELGIINDGVIQDITFLEDKDKIGVNKFKVDMINSNFNIGYQVNREALHEILVNLKVTCRYEPCMHACVNIKYKPDSAIKNVSIFVFQSGNIIITGAKNTESILDSYDYINKLLSKYKNEIKKNIINPNILNNLNNDKILKELFKLNGDFKGCELSNNLLNSI